MHIVLVAVLLAQTPIDWNTAIDGVYRKNLATWVAGPGLELGKQQAAQDLAEAKSALTAVQSARINSKLTKMESRRVGKREVVAFPSTAKKKEAIEAVKAVIEDANKRFDNPPVAFPIMDVAKIAPGKIGRLRTNREYQPNFETVQVIDDANVIVRFHTTKDLVWLCIPTKGMVDKKVYSVDEDQIFEAVDTTRYQTVNGGTNTIPKLVRRSVAELTK